MKKPLLSELTLREKIGQLGNYRNWDIANKIRVARSFGDISENSEYDAAREEEALLEQEITQIENTLRNAKLISKVKVDSTKVNVGCTVTMYDETCKEDLIFKIMGSFESDPTKGQISNESPIGKAIMGKEVGDRVQVDVPNGEKMILVIKDIKY